MSGRVSARSALLLAAAVSVTVAVAFVITWAATGDELWLALALLMVIDVVVMLALRTRYPQ